MDTDSRSKQHYWAKLLLSIRSNRGWNQSKLAEELVTNQETVSRWERSIVVPSKSKQAAIEHLAEHSNISSLGAVCHIVRLSPYPMLLCDGGDVVIAASRSSGFTEGHPVKSQTPTAQHSYYEQFSRELAEDGFWSDSGRYRNYHFTSPQGEFNAVLVSIRIQGSVYCVVQAIPTGIP